MQLLASVIATIQWHPPTPHDHEGQNVAALIIVQAFGLGILAGPVAAYFIDKATTKQCLAHDWPKEADQIHRDWCITNGYKI